MKNKLHKTLRGKFLIITIALMLLLGIGTTTFSYIMFSNNLRSNSIHAAETNLQFMRNEINQNLESVQQLSKWSCSNSDIISYISSSPEDDRYNALTKQATNRLAEEYNSTPGNSYISRIVIANMDTGKFLQRIATSQYSADSSMVTIIESLPYYDELLNASEYTFSLGVQIDPFTAMPDKMLPIIRPIEDQYGKAVIGFSYLQVSINLFTDPLVSYSMQEKISAYITIADELYCVSGNTLSKLDVPVDVSEYSHNDFVSSDTLIHKVGSGRDSQLYVTSPLSADGCFISIPLSANSQVSSVMGYFSILAAIILLVMIIGLILLWFLTHNVTKPVKMLKTQIDSIAGGDFSQDPSIEWDNELGDIGHNINQLAVDISSLMKQRIEYEKQKKDYEYQMLQSQINPHFLYNTLSSIKWMATAQHAEGIAEMTTALAHLLKSISKGTSTIVPIQEELRLLDDYFTIQKYRYGGTITMGYRIDDDDLPACPIIRFTLQPIVENAIFHGIEPKGTSGHIDIHIYREDEKDLRIDIKDDGIGMDQATINRILADESSDRSSFFRQMGIGIVNKRIQYNFGEKYGLTIHSVLSEYTCMSILLPANLNDAKGVDDDEIADCR